MSFVVVRHPEAGVGTVPTAALEHLEANGWVRVSDEREMPSDFHLPDYADATAEAPEPEQEPKKGPAKTTKKESTE